MAAVPEIDQLKAEIGPGTPIEQLATASALAERLRARGDELLDQFVDAADVLSAAAAQAKDLGHHYIRPEHLILGLLTQPDEMAGRVLADLGVTLQDARERVAARFGGGAPRPTGSLGIAPQTKRLLELARTIANSLGHRRGPRTEHILLAATAAKLHSPAATLLDECGASPDVVHEKIMRTILEQAPELADSLRNRTLFSRVRMRRV